METRGESTHRKGESIQNKEGQGKNRGPSVPRARRRALGVDDQREAFAILVEHGFLQLG